MIIVLLMFFLVLLIASALMVVTARRGDVATDDGYAAVPERVRADPVLARRADVEIGRHGLYGVTLSLAPVLYATWMLVFGGSDEVPTGVLAAAAVLGTLAVVVLLVPFERMRRW